MVWSPATIESYKVARVLFPNCSTFYVWYYEEQWLYAQGIGYFVYERTYFLTFVHVHVCT